MTEITVLMAVYNTPLDLLGHAVDSIVGQSRGDFEFLIVDDGSQDAATPDYLAARASADTRIRLVREPHRGLTASLNRGLELAQGAWIARQDADDWSAPRRLERQFGFLAAHPELVLCGSNVWTHQQTGRPLWRTRLPLTSVDVAAAFARGNPFVHGSVMFSRRHARAIGGYREAFRCSQDYDFFWRLSETGQAANLVEPLYHYRYTAGSVSANRAIEQNIAHLAAGRLAARRSAARQPEAAPDSAAGGKGIGGQLEAPEDLAVELQAAEQAVCRTQAGTLRVELRQADHLLLAGAYRRALWAYLNLARSHPASAIVWAKLARCGVFLALPPIRQACFR
jgi:hypothetical protein